MKNIVFLCLLLCLNVKYIFTKCACISTQTKYSENTNVDNKKQTQNIHYKRQRAKELSFKHNKNRLGIIYEDIEYTTINDIH